MNRLYTFEELMDDTGLSKYELRYFQSKGYFLEVDRSRYGIRGESGFDRTWKKVWEEAKRYKKVGFDELEALHYATLDLEPEGYEEEFS
jgi:DNA-binding transcriptional MerR regulator